MPSETPRSCTAHYNSYAPPTPAATATPASRSGSKADVLMWVMVQVGSSSSLPPTRSGWSGSCVIHSRAAPHSCSTFSTLQVWSGCECQQT